MLQVSMGSMALSHPIARPRPGSDNGHLTTFRRGRRISTMPPHRLGQLFRPARASSNAVLLDAEWSGCLDPTCRTPHAARRECLRACWGGGRDHRGVPSDVASPAGSVWVGRGRASRPKRAIDAQTISLGTILDPRRWELAPPIDHVDLLPLLPVACCTIGLTRKPSFPPTSRCARLRVVGSLLRGFPPMQPIGT